MSRAYFRRLSLTLVFALGVLSPHLPAKNEPPEQTNRRHVIVVPGIMGSALRDNNGHPVWVDRFKLALHSCDDFLLNLALSPDGVTPARPFTYRCWPSKEDVSASGIPVVAKDLLTGELGRYYWIPDFYGDLMKNLAKDFDVEGFPYDWRLDYDQAAQNLRAEVERIIQAGAGSVDIVAHSQGGLVVRVYLEKYSSNPLIHTVVFLGTPHRGAPKSFAILSGWQAFESYYGRAVPAMNFYTGSYIAQNFPATYELLPQDKFLDVDNNLQQLGQTYAGLTNQDLVKKASALWHYIDAPPPPTVNLFAINGSGHNTLSKLHRRAKDGCMMPEDDPSGDGTVPWDSSSRFVNANYNYYVREEHAALPNSAVVDEAARDLLLQGKPTNLSPKGEVRDRPFTESYVRAYTCGPLSMSLSNLDGGTLELSLAGFLHNTIPDSQLFVFPQSYAAFFPEGRYVLLLEGKAQGTASLTVEFVLAKTESKSYRFPELAISDKFRAKVLINPGFRELPMLLDENGEGKFEKQLIKYPD